MKLIKIAFTALALSFSANVLAEDLDDNIGFDATETVQAPTLPAWTRDANKNIARVSSKDNTATLELFAVDLDGKVRGVGVLTYPESTFDCRATRNKFYDVKVMHMKVSVPRFCRKNENGTFSTGFTFSGAAYLDLSRAIYLQMGRQFTVAGHVFGTENYRESYTPVARAIVY